MARDGPDGPDLDADLRLLVGYGIKRANAALTPHIERILGGFGLRRSTYSALSVLAGHPGLRQSDLSEVLAIERPNLVQILDELRHSGLVVRSRDPADRRAWRLRVTPAGAEVLAQARRALMAYDQRLTAGLGKAERKALIAALQRVERLGAEAWEGRDVGEISTT